jgi:SAM-dependent methyltransferase
MDEIPRRSLDAATGYQDVLVPALMEAWAPRVADAAAIRAGDRVLDVACGTGVLTREAASRAGPAGSVTGLDLSPEMLAVAARLSPTLKWQEGSAGALPFADQSFNAVVSQFGLMFFPDRAAALQEMMRVLLPGGRLAVAVWGSLEETPAYAAEVELVERLAGKAAGDALRAPFVLGTPERMAELCDKAGITGADIALRPGRGHFLSIRTMVLVDVRDWLQFVGITLEELLIERILQEAETALRPYLKVDGSGVWFDSPAVLTTARRPSAPASVL